MSSFSTLTLDPDNVSNTLVRDEDLKVLYSVETVFPGSKTLTYVRNGDSVLIATLEWRESLSDKVTLGNSKTIPLSDWLKKSFIPFNSCVFSAVVFLRCLIKRIPARSATFKDEKKRGYKWEGNAPGMQFQVNRDSRNPEKKAMLTL